MSGGLAQREPLFPEVGIVAMVPDPWDSPWMPRHQVLARLSDYFQVAWMNPARGWREVWWPPRRRNGSGAEDGSFYAHEPRFPGFYLYSHGRWTPKFYRPAGLAKATEKARLRQAWRVLKSHGAKKSILYLWRPEFAEATRYLSADLLVYHIDDEYSFSEQELPLDEREERLIRMADLVIIHSPGLLERKGHLNPATIHVPNGVNFEAYAAEHPEPEDLAKVPQPRVGYVGVLKNQLDFGLLLRLAQRHPEVSFVFVGPALKNLQEQADSFRRLRLLSNTYFLGAKPVERLPAYVHHLDVCLLPYRVNPYTHCIYPLKLHEYLAAGKPVIGSPIRSLERFDDIIEIAGTADEWHRSLQRSLQPRAGSAQRVAQRRHVAAAHDWDRLVEKIALAMSEKLGGDYADQLRAAARHIEVAPVHAEVDHA